MLPVANLHLKDLYDTTVEFFALRSPSFSFRSFATDDSSSSSLSDPGSPSQTNLTPVRDPLAKLTRECANLREKLDVAEHRHCPSTCSCRLLPGPSAPNSSFHSMRRELDATKNELARQRSEVNKLEERCRLLEKTLRETREMLKARDMEVERLKKGGVERPSTADRRRSQDQNSDSGHHQLETLDEGSKVDGLQRSHMRGGSVSSSSASEEDRAQIRSLEPFLTKVDRWSGAQVIQAVHDLNSEILQFAASATELCTFEKASRSSPPKNVQATQDTTSRVGPLLVRILSSRDHSQDPILVQLALQGCISTCIARAMSTFCLGFQTKSNALLAQIYLQMSMAEPQPTSSRWRALTHRHIHTLHPDLEEFAVNDLADTVLRWASDVFTVSGCATPETTGLSREGLRTRFGAQVRRIAKAVFKLTQVTREEIMSTNFEVVSVEHGETFDARAMYDAFEDYAPSKGAILCTTELGVRCSTRRSVSEQMTRDESAIERRMLLQPKIVLESVVDVLDPK